jgi:flagellar biosynthesis/type III secretory pathway protein FliH
MAQQRNGGVVAGDRVLSVGDALFTKPVPGAGEASPLNLPQSERSDSDESPEARVLALLSRPELYQDRMAKRDQTLTDRDAEMDRRHAELDERSRDLDARHGQLVAQEEAQKRLVLEAAEAEVERLADRALAEERARLVRTVTELEAVAAGLLDQARIDLLELSVKLAQKIIGAELNTRPQLLVGLIRSALESAAPTGAVTLHLHPRDAALLKSRGAKVLGKLPPSIKINLKADESIDRGGVAIASQAGRVDATIGARLQRVGSALAEVIDE